MMLMVNIKNRKCCAFCKYWYDPANNHIQPVKPKSNLWKCDLDAKSICSAYDSRFRETKGGLYCRKYECKLELH